MKLNSIINRCIIALVIIVMLFVTFWLMNHRGYKIETGGQYEITRPVYLVGVYKSLNNRQISRETALGYLEVKHSYKKSTVAFQEKVPTGTIMTIVGPAPKVWHLFFLPDRYFIKLKPDLSRELDIIIELSRGMEGPLEGFNPEIFARLE